MPITYSLTDYKGLQVVTPDPAGVGGLAINDNFKALADGTEAVDEALDGKADRVVGATPGRLAALDATGNLTDSGIAASGGLLDLNGGNIRVVPSYPRRNNDINSWPWATVVPVAAWRSA